MGAVLKRYRLQILVSLAFAGLLLAFTIASPRTFTGMRIYRSFMSTIPVTAVLAMGMTLLVVDGDMDLSFPSVAAASAYLFAEVFVRTGSSWFAFGAAILSGAFIGWTNGLVVVRIGVPSIIATIGTQFFWRGLVLLLSDGVAVSLASIRGNGLHSLLVGRLGGEIPAQFLWCLAIALGLALLLNRHSFGDSLLFVGDNRRAAAMMGIPVERVRILAFVLMGVLSAFAGMLSTLELANWWPTQGEGYMLLVFASVFVGGTSAYGGEGTIYGSLIGAAMIGIIEAGIVSAGLAGFWTRLIYGLIIVVSVSIYTLMAKRGGTS
ncbi:inner-membrane translocator [Dethiosulfovibrio peptidovorans DSM 11002]|uniref:Inner-membrane translocator n=1 Tax=Dethiosulfovibrio peptidovorans DSM 11002 TaxID=469381 RepID=D2Z775_9BACT|nr:ABC transporter permease [Dethiosulfovibrio peptidovorans]EFC91322.1 inner-membrane translocator [Dethiosulfovibrio peptidovorans DSM 11002]